MEQRSLLVYKNLKAAQEKFDYFVLGMTAALFAYLGENYAPEQLGLSQNTVELISLLLLLISLVAGFKRLKFDLALQQGNFYELDLDERRNVMNQALSVSGSVLNLNTGDAVNKEAVAARAKQIQERLPSLLKATEKYARKGSMAYSVRNWSLLSGFVLLAVSKFLGAYAAT